MAHDDELIRWWGLKRVSEATQCTTIADLVQSVERPVLRLDDEKISTIAARALAAFGYSALDVYLNAESERSSDRALACLADALGLLADTRALPWLERLMAKDSPRVWSWASLGLARLGERAIPSVVDLLHHADSMRKAAFLMDALTKIGTPDALGANQDYLHNCPFPEIRAHYHAQEE